MDKTKNLVTMAWSSTRTLSFPYELVQIWYSDKSSNDIFYTYGKDYPGRRHVFPKIQYGPMDNFRAGCLSNYPLYFRQGILTRKG